MNRQLRFDELNVLRNELRERIPAHIAAADLEAIEDDIENLLIVSYAFGTDSANDDLGSSIKIDIEEAKDTIYREVGGKNWVDRVAEHFVNADAAAILKVAETESDRDFSEGGLTAAKKAGAARKTWVTMRDDRVRDTHDYLHGMTVGIDDKFFTYDGDSAATPGGFESAEENVNCRCYLRFAK